jgi:TRAP-type mannitol/chloroaromatic compound transport system permease small subunit
LPEAVKAYVRFIDAMNRRVGRFAMYLLFAMMGILLYSSISKTFFHPSLWTLEMAQFTMVAYYLLGGGYSMQLGSHVRMDLAYGFWSDKTKAAVDAFTVFFLIYFLWVLLAGGVSSTAYSLGYYGAEPFTFFKDVGVAFLTGGIEGAEELIGRLERSSTAWRPIVWPIKVIMCLGIFLMLLQTINMFLKDVAKVRGEDLS